MAEQDPPGGAATPLTIIIKKVGAYYDKMNRIAKFLDDHEAPADTRINKTEEYLQFFIDKPSLADLNKMAGLKDFDSLAVFLGLTDPINGNGVTGCVLAVDMQGKILPEHFLEGGGGIQPQDTWLPPGPKGPALYEPRAQDFTLDTEVTTLRDHFTPS